MEMVPSLPLPVELAPLLALFTLAGGPWTMLGGFFLGSYLWFG